jgi:chemotaxis protein methyltransferase CheR
MQEDRTAFHWAFIEIEQNKAAKMPVFQAAKNSLVDYRRHNLLEPMTGPKIDCIFIRNVLIYFNSASKPVALRNLVDALHRGGFLVVGATDGGHDYLAGMERCSTFLYRKP